MKQIGIYAIVLNAPDKPGQVYIGQSADISFRLAYHFNTLRCGIHHNIHMQRAYDKYGRIAFSTSIVALCSASELTAFEQATIDMYAKIFGTRFLLNIAQECCTSRKGTKHFPETIQRMSLAKKGKKKSPEHIAALSAAAKKRYESPVARAEASARMKGRHPSPQCQAARTAAATGRVHTPEHLAKIAETKKANPYRHNAETRLKMSEAAKNRSRIS